MQGPVIFWFIEIMDGIVWIPVIKTDILYKNATKFDSLIKK